MRIGASLQTRLALALGLSVTLLWLAAAAVTAHRLGGQMEEVFDDGLKATAQRILPIARHDLREDHQGRDATDYDDNGEDDDGDGRIGREARYGEDVSFIVREQTGQVLLGSKGADASIFPPFTKRGFLRTATHQLYYDTSFDGKLTIAVAEPLDHRTELSRKMLLGLVLPLIVVIPLSLLAIYLAVRRSLRPVRALRQELANRGAQDLSPVTDSGLPTELLPISAGVNQLLDRLTAAFHAERAFAANAAHELRTPVAGAIAQAQRIRSETKEKLTSQRAAEIETTLKRLMRVSEKLMQLARAEGGRLQSDEPSDLRTVLQMVLQDFARAGEGRISLRVPQAPVLSMLDPDAVGILCRNLIENALKHGALDGKVEVSLQLGGLLSVANDGPILPPDAIDRLMRRFERGNVEIGGSGVGLAIVKAIADRIGADVTIVSPRPARNEGVQVEIKLPVWSPRLSV
ncbi:sensor histidine kinase [Rhizobium binae]|uniref:histidine kinase n=1 Tax=Rhizobium binae TaxID=1138190 RepID=A0ABV2MED5_9HYPH|nr:ATP-binding protein [Rhizobium binae]NKL47239.1 HAMP domain-containing protein [Rhizobium leguminosarum bv. viciae]MBX4941099.1 two-component sensor histidine kinase [Rhizobium binae]MBX4943484.1 two-component sensor histidine kinase [Rhizobium binae]MBX4949368.1 two-component sensor histidine kinase [Rhizobium binae]MBX4960792.1 two-component sensor histidine kinase [Rhizobium binae]